MTDFTPDEAPAEVPVAASGLLDDPERLLTAEELAAVARVPINTVRVWSTRGGGPRRIRIGKYARYRVADVREWLDAAYAD